MARDIKQLAGDLARNGAELHKYIQKDLPRIVGKLGVDQFQESFENQGFLNNGFQPWDKRKTETGRPILVGETKELQNSIDYEVNGKQVGFVTDVEYGHIHNVGGKTKPHEIRAKRGRALKFGGRGGTDVYRRKVNHPGSEIPARPFIGHSEELIDKIDARVERDINKILDK